MGCNRGATMAIRRNPSFSAVIMSSARHAGPNGLKFKRIRGGLCSAPSVIPLFVHRMSHRREMSQRRK